MAELLPIVSGLLLGGLVAVRGRFLQMWPAGSPTGTGRARSVRRSSTRGARTGMLPATVVTSRWRAWPLRTTRASLTAHAGSQSRRAARTSQLW
jgi:hypothetical protein